jgi:hypothetical protein
VYQICHPPPILQDQPLLSSAGFVETVAFLPVMSWYLNLVQIRKHPFFTFDDEAVKICDNNKMEKKKKGGSRLPQEVAGLQHRRSRLGDPSTVKKNPDPVLFLTTTPYCLRIRQPRQATPAQSSTQRQLVAQRFPPVFTPPPPPPTEYHRAFIPVLR